jgi:hypothetical protein
MKKVGTLKLGIGLSILLFLLSYLTDSADGGILAIFSLPLIPGFIIFVLTTGDIHGWQPGPVGEIGRILVIAIGSWFFWYPVLYLIIKKLNQKKINS